MRQAGYLQRLYRDAARSTEHKFLCSFLISVHSPRLNQSNTSLLSEGYKLYSSSLFTSSQPSVTSCSVLSKSLLITVFTSNLHPPQQRSLSALLLGRDAASRPRRTEQSSFKTFNKTGVDKFAEGLESNPEFQPPEGDMQQTAPQTLCITWTS